MAGPNGSLDVGALSDEEAIAVFDEMRRDPLGQEPDEAGEVVEESTEVVDETVGDLEADGTIVPDSVPLPKLRAERTARQARDERIAALEQELQSRGVRLEQAERLNAQWQENLHRAQQIRQQQELEARQAQVYQQRQAVAAQDPEPDKENEWDLWLEWRDRQREQRIAALENTLEGRTQQVAQTLEWNQTVAAVNERKMELGAIEDHWKAQPGHEDYEQAYAYLEGYHQRELQLLYGNSVNATTGNPMWRDQLDYRRATLLASCININPQTGKPDARLGWRQDRHLPSIVEGLARAAGYPGAGGMQQAPQRQAAQGGGRRGALSRSGVPASGRDRVSALARTTAAAAGRDVGHGGGSAGGEPDLEALIGMSKESFEAFYDDQQRALFGVMGRNYR